MKPDRVCVCPSSCASLSRGFRVCLGACNRPKLQWQFRLLGNFKKPALLAGVWWVGVTVPTRSVNRHTGIKAHTPNTTTEPRKQTTLLTKNKSMI